MNLRVEYQYFGPITSWIALIKATNVDFCKYDIWVKGSFRNRCLLPGANGVINLSIPVVGGREQKMIYGDVRIDYKSNWREIHWRTIFSVYGKSPWFLFYRNELENLYSTNPEFLVDWNDQCNKWIARQVRAKFQVLEKDNMKTDLVDFGDKIKPSNFNKSGMLEFPKYAQVFEDRIGFKSNMSILDLLCCEGKHAATILQNAAQTFGFPPLSF